MPELQFTCDHCNKPIKPAEGALFITGDEVEKAHKFINNGTAVTPTSGDAFADLMNAAAVQQQRGQYQAMHDDCFDALGLQAVYVIELSRLNTYGHLLAWNSHLQEKSWQKGSNFHGIMVKMAPEVPA